MTQPATVVVTGGAENYTGGIFVSAFWLQHFSALQVRVARAMDRLKGVVDFDHDSLRRPIIESFNAHPRYAGVMLGLSGHEDHPEFTQHGSGSFCPAPTRDNGLFLPLPNPEALESVVARLQKLGPMPVAVENPSWLDCPVTLEDPDGWRMVPMRSYGLTLSLEDPRGEKLRTVR